MFLLAIAWLLLIVPGPVRAETEIRGYISENQVWKPSGSPYMIHESVFVPDRVKIQIQKGVKVIFTNAQMVFEGELEILGEPESSENITSSSGVLIEQDGDSTGFFIKGGKAFVAGAKVTGGKKFIEVFEQGNLSLSKSHIHLDADSFSSVAARQGSFADINNNIFIVNSSGYTVESYDALVDISDNTFRSATSHLLGDTGSANATGLAIYTTHYSQNPHSAFTANIKNNTFVGLKTGLEIFGNKTYATVQKNTFSKNNTYGLTAHSGATLEVFDNTFENNGIGIAQYNASSTIKNNIFENNTQLALEAYGGTVYAKENWWNSSTGPYHSVLNTPGTGEITETDPAAVLYPWLFEKPKKSQCCSSILFIPGLQGSRLYRKSFGMERLLWEPNRNGDIKNLFMNENGESKAAGIYAKGVIDKVLYLAGYVEKDIYKDFISRLNLHKKEKTIYDWKTFAYDWRYAPEQIVDKNKESVIATVQSLAKGARNGKVMIVAHSYGGLVADEILKSLESQGLAYLVDKVMLVGVPEHGSTFALSALLHGDGQSIGKGLITSAKNARALALNSGSTYSLLPTQNDFQTGTIVRRGDVMDFKGRSIRDVQSMLGFLVRDGEFSNVPSANSTPVGQTVNDSNTDTPSRANEYLLNKYYLPRATSLPLPNMRRLSDRSYVYANSAVQGSNVTASTAVLHPLKVYNVIAKGLQTLSGTRYTEHCPKMTLASVFSLRLFGGKSSPRSGSGSQVGPDARCELKRTPLMDSRGDSTVLLGDISKRVGYKMILDLAEYNRIKETSHNHADIMSSGAVLSLMYNIMQQNKPSFYDSLFTKHFDQSLATDYATYHSAELENLDVLSQEDLANNKEYQFISIKGDGSDCDSVTCQDSDISIHTILDTGVTNTNQNTRFEYLDFAGEKYYFTDIKPLTVKASSSKMQTVDITVGYSGGASTSNQNSNMTNLVYTFSNVLVSADTNIQISTGGVSVASATSTSQNTSTQNILGEIASSGQSGVSTSSLQNIAPVLSLDLNGDGISDINETPSTVNVSVEIGAASGGVGASGNGTSTEYQLETGQLMDPESYAENILQTFERMKLQISESSIREPYKSRYYRKVLALERKYNANPIVFGSVDLTSLSSVSFKYLEQNVKSLMVMIEELSKEKRRFYIGGLRRPEAEFLHREFYLMIRAFLGLKTG